MALFTTSIASAHSGGTDSNGCHSGTKAYHCH
ncbi:YHYH domain-containing protein [Aliamphritea hakodatensis]|nr:YHYH domain-containing protein [Aliamphritea hakodatensis]